MKLKALLTPFIAAAVCATVQPVSAADSHGAPGSQQPAPSAEAMILDGLVYRPLTLAGTVVGTGIFLATLPFSWAGGNAQAAGNRLVIEPAKSTFTRCLGCLEQYGGPAGQ